jgi:hypothetical protein
MLEAPWRSRTRHKKLVVFYGYRASVIDDRECLQHHGVWVALEPMKSAGWALGFVRDLPDKTDITDPRSRTESIILH